MKDISADETNVSLGTLLLKDFCKGELTGVKAGKLKVIYIYIYIESLGKGSGS